MRNRTTATKTIHRQDIFKPIKVLKHYKEDNIDFALIEIDRPVPANRILEFDEEPLTNRSNLYIIGYPLGLPVKYTDGAKVLKNDANWFTASLDSYEGNSGSPVFSAVNDKVVGILIKGDGDFTISQVGSRCLISKVCTTLSDECKGEWVIKMVFVKQQFAN